MDSDKPKSQPECTTLDKLRSHRILTISSFDLLLFIVGIIITSIIYKEKEIAIWRIIIIFFLLGFLTHYLLKIPTMLGYYLRLNEKPKAKKC